MIIFGLVCTLFVNRGIKALLTIKLGSIVLA
jgi:hypothetical protein